ncbi:VENN motif pre-toxin domain-containing protein, partial [Escherichia coli]|nr:VENN motif pre-toxin domain-containing protein [Escherichia coli]
QQRLQQAQLIGEIGNQVADIARTEGQIAGEKAKRDPAALNQARAELEAAGKPFTEQDVAQRAYNNGMAASGFGTGGKYQQAIQAATAAVQGLAGGNLRAALAGGAAPYLAEVVKTMTTDPVTGEVNKAANVAAHAVVNAALSLAQGNNALAGAAGAATGEVVGMIATQMYGKPVSELSETEKQTVSTLATVAAGLAGGLVGDSGASAVAGAQSGKTTVENNALGNKNDKLPPIIPINPLPIGVEGADGEPLNGGGGIAKGGKSKDTQIWTETKKAEPVGNAYGHWTKHGKEFPEYQNAKQYVDAAHNFMTNPPPGTLTKTRPNGDTLYYNPVTNVFASKDINGVPRTMFKPEKGIEYWNKQ